MNVEDNIDPVDPDAIDPAAIDDVDPQPSADDPAADPNADDAPPAKPRQSAQERIDELTRARREAERRADMLEGRLAQLEASKEPKTDPQPKGDGRPNPAEYAAGEYDPAYVEALTDWKVDQKLNTRLAEREQKTEQQQRDEAFQGRVKAASEKFTDFNDKVFGGAERGTWVCTQDMLEILKESEVGPEVAYHLASNPAEAQRIASLTPRAQAMAIGRLEAGLSGSTKPKPKIVSDAPDPATTTRGTSGRFQVAPDTNDFAAFDKAF